MNAESPIKEIMVTELYIIGPKDPLRKAQRIFEEKGFHHLIVTDNGELAGILSKSDLLNFLWQQWTNGAESMSKNVMVEELMTANPITIDADDTIGLAADIFLSNRLHALPVLDGSALVGVVTNHDLLHYSYR